MQVPVSGGMQHLTISREAHNMQIAGKEVGKCYKSNNILVTTGLNATVYIHSSDDIVELTGVLKSAKIMTAINRLLKGK